MLQRINFNFKNNRKDILGLIYNDILSENLINVFEYPDGVYRVSIIDINDIIETNMYNKEWENETENFYNDTTRKSIIKFVSGKSLTINDIIYNFNKIN